VVARAPRRVCAVELLVEPIRSRTASRIASRGPVANVAPAPNTAVGQQLDAKATSVDVTRANRAATVARL